MANLVPGEAVAIVRIQSIRVQSSLRRAVRHRLLPPHEELTHVDYFYDDDHLYDVFPDDIFFHSKTPTDAIVEFFMCAESCSYRKKIRKNSVIQEIIIAYSPGEVTSADVRSDVNAFTSSFKEKFGFVPHGTYFIHKKEDSYHVHILFSLMNPSTARKVRWRKRDYFDIVKKMSERTRTISPPKKTSKKIGAYPLWLVQLFREWYGPELTRELISLARKKRFTTSDLFDFDKVSGLYEISKRKKDGLTPGPDL